ncbi:MAG: hypothetical protein AAF605_02600 [Myxococcota bacterium]
MVSVLVLMLPPSPFAPPDEGMDEPISKRAAAAATSDSAPIVPSFEGLAVELVPPEHQDLVAAARFLAPRLATLLEGETPLLRLVIAQEGAQARFSLYEGQVLLTERTQTRSEDGYDPLPVWLAMKGAWTRSRETAAKEPGSASQPGGSASESAAPPPTRPNEIAPPSPVSAANPSVRGLDVATSLDGTASSRAITLGALGVYRSSRLSSAGATLGFGHAASGWSGAGDVGYRFSPVDRRLNVHHLFAQLHFGYAPQSGWAIESTARLGVQFASTPAEVESTLDLGLGGGVLVGRRSTVWVRATVLGHPTTQRYLLDDGSRSSSRLSVGVGAGVAL